MASGLGKKHRIEEKRHRIGAVTKLLLGLFVAGPIKPNCDSPIEPDRDKISSFSLLSSPSLSTLSISSPHFTCRNPKFCIILYHSILNRIKATDSHRYLPPQFPYWSIMLSGVKFISREEIGKEKNEKKSGSSRKEKHVKKKSYSSSDEDQSAEKVGRRKKKWYSSEEYSSESDSDSENSEDRNKKKRRSGKKKKSKSKRKNYSSEESSEDDDDGKDRKHKGSGKGRRKRDGRGSALSGDDKGDDMVIKRKEMGLDWMLRPKEPTDTDKTTTVNAEDQLEESPIEEVKKPNPRELNPYFKNDGTGYPEEADGAKTGGSRLQAPSVIGDGGASWRLKALKRAQEQAAREGRKLNEVVEERWGSVGQLAVSAASHSAAPSRAHLHAIRSRQKDVDKKNEKDPEKNTGRDYLRDVSHRHRDMKAPKVHDNLSWGKRKLPSKEAGVISAAMATLNRFSNDGSFMQEAQKQSDGVDDSLGNTKCEVESKPELVSLESDIAGDVIPVVTEGLSANQLAAKALQLRMKGKHAEAEQLMQEAERIKAKPQESSTRHRNIGSTSRLLMKDMSSRDKKREEDADMHLAQNIMQNKKYSMSGRADDEYDFDGGPSKKSRKKGGDNDRNKVSQRSSLATRILTQQERCLYCFENPNRPKHLVVSIANFTYLMLPQFQSVAPGHCCILTVQHESSTRTVDDNVWDEIRNFKKCLIMMFAKQDKELIFLETVMGLAQQRRHCMVECIPLPQDIAKEAPLYFKKAIDEAEDEWSQHNAKKLIDTSVKGLRGSIPKDFPYFHVEFGLKKGFVHVIDDEKQFKSNLGLNVIRGMLELAEEDMYRRRRTESVETQKQAVLEFARDWEPFDWTKQLY